MRLFRRKCLAVDFGDAQRRAVAAEFSLVLNPDDMLSSLPVGFRDQVNAAHAVATEAQSAAEGFDFRLRAVELAGSDGSTIKAHETVHVSSSASGLTVSFDKLRCG